ncbi:MAG TPA: DNA replication and repair protein RecF [Polyangiaceae bacterium]|nr:DNA replication and repair protein RecF [Polyangiaceae bacterium]
MTEDDGSAPPSPSQRGHFASFDASERVSFNRLVVRHFRNLRDVALTPEPRFNLIRGDNGQGKTSLIEAIYVLATTRSFRTTRLADVIEQGEEKAQLAARVASRGFTRELRAEFGLRSRSFSLDGKRAKRKLDYALSTPVVAFHPGDLNLVSGPAGARRLLLDRVLVYLDPAGGEARLRFLEALRERQRALAERGPQARELEAYDLILAQQGARFALARQRAVDELGRHLTASFERMAPAGLQLTVDYRPGGTTDELDFARRLAADRPRDFRRGAASFGPQRDELELSLAGRAARTHASQGQQRLLALALKLAEQSSVRAITGLDPLLLLDDVSSELDRERTRAVFEFLERTESQVFVTTTRPELFDGVQPNRGERGDFELAEGRLVGSRQPSSKLPGTSG